MTQDIRIIETENGHYEVVVDDGVGEPTVHMVNIEDEYLEELGVDAGRQEAIEDLLRYSFQFLLKREPKEHILREFELPKIERHFPEYRKAVADHLAASEG